MLSRCVAADTKTFYWGMMLWVLLQLVAGTFARRDWEGIAYTGGHGLDMAGSQICGGLFFAVWLIKGDMDWYLFFMAYLMLYLICQNKEYR